MQFKDRENKPESKYNKALSSVKKQQHNYK